MPFADQDITAEATIAGGFFLLNESRLQDFETFLRPCGIRMAVHKNTQGRMDFLKELAPAAMSALQFILLDLTEQPDPLALAREVVGRCSPGTAVVAMGTANDVALYRDLRALGVGDYLLAPVSGPAAQQAVNFVLGRVQASDSSCMVAFYATHGGVGAGLLAAGTAAQIAGIHGRDTVCVDADLGGPSLGSHLGIDKPGNLPQLLLAGERLDDSLVQQAQRQLQDNLFLLNGYEPTRGELPGEEATAKALLGFLRRQHRFQILRVSGAGALTGQALRQADIIYLVTTGTLASAAAAQAMFEWLGRNNPRAVTAQIFNTVAPKQPLTPAMLAQVTGRENKYVIGWKNGLARSLAANVSPTERKHAMYREFTALSGEIVGVGAPRKGLFGRFSV